MMVAYSDASLKHGHIGIGFKLYRPPTGDVGSEPVTDLSHSLHEADDLDGDYTSHMAEYAAVIEAVRAATKYDVGALVVASDCPEIVEKIRRLEPITEDCRFRDALQSLLTEFDDWRVRRVARDRNGDAHDQAKKAIRCAPTQSK